MEVSFRMSVVSLNSPALLSGSYLVRGDVLASFVSI